jgi:histone RNA hairpin-binding protein
VFDLFLKLLHVESEKETNEHRIENRMKQITFGKNTIGYDNYVAAVPK